MSDEAVQRFITRHAKPPREAVADDAAPYVGMSPEERAVHLDAACRLAAEALLASPWRDRVLRRRDPPHEDWWVLVRRGRG
jgi:hypothetical protein